MANPGTMSDTNSPQGHGLTEAEGGGGVVAGVDGVRSVLDDDDDDGGADDRRREVLIDRRGLARGSSQPRYSVYGTCREDKQCRSELTYTAG